MNQIFLPLLNKYVVYFDNNILIYSKSTKEHLLHLKEVFSILVSNSLFINFKKCTFLITSISFLGFIISGKCIQASPNELKAFTNW